MLDLKEVMEARSDDPKDSGSVDAQAKESELKQRLSGSSDGGERGQLPNVGTAGSVPSRAKESGPRGDEGRELQPSSSSTSPATVKDSDFATSSPASDVDASPVYQDSKRGEDAEHNVESAQLSTEGMKQSVKSVAKEIAVTTYTSLEERLKPTLTPIESTSAGKSETIPPRPRSLSMDDVSERLKEEAIDLEAHSNVPADDRHPPKVIVTTAQVPVRSSRGKQGALRRGKWTVEEEAYVARVIQDFNSGFLDAPAGTTLRTYLSAKLQCDPMRITKKFTGDACIGKRVFHPAVRSPSNSVAIDTAQVRPGAVGLFNNFLSHILFL